MENIFDSAKTIQEKRTILKGLSKPLQILVKEAAIPTKSGILFPIEEKYSSGAGSRTCEVEIHTEP